MIGVLYMLYIYSIKTLMETVAHSHTSKASRGGCKPGDGVCAANIPPELPAERCCLLGVAGVPPLSGRRMMVRTQQGGIAKCDLRPVGRAGDLFFYRRS